MDLFAGNALLQLIDQLKAVFITRNEPTIGARVYNSAAITLTTSVSTALTFNSERKNSGGVHSTASNTSRLTAPASGTYIITGTADFDSNATGRRVLKIILNGTTEIANDARLALTAAGEWTRVSIATQYDLAAGDYVELYAVQSSGGNLNILVTGNTSPEFSMVLIR